MLPASADDAPRGRRIGNGVNLPREIVAGKDPSLRATEIWRWMGEKVNKTNRECSTEERMCFDSIVIPLDTGAGLVMFRFQPTDGRATIDVYCRSNPQLDTRVCYRMQTDEYFFQTKDTRTKKWEITWEEKPKGATPAAKFKSDIEL